MVRDLLCECKYHAAVRIEVGNALRSGAPGPTGLVLLLNPKPEGKSASSAQVQAIIGPCTQLRAAFSTSRAEVLLRWVVLVSVHCRGQRPAPG